MFSEPSPTVEDFVAVFPLAGLREIARTIVGACAPAVQRCEQKYPKNMLPQAIGTERYLDIHAALHNLKALRRIVPILSISSERHEGGTTYFTAIETPDARIAANKGDSPFATPEPHQIAQTRPSRLSLFDQNEKQWGTIMYGFGANPAIVAFMYLLILHPAGFYVPNERLDLLALLKTAASDAPVEPPTGTTTTPLRTGKQIQRPGRKPNLG